jgi:hypothetical protein
VVFIEAKSTTLSKEWNQIFGMNRGQGCQMIYFQTKNPSVWVNFEGPCNGEGWHILWSFGIYDGHLVYFMAISGNLVLFPPAFVY